MQVELAAGDVVVGAVVVVDAAGLQIQNRVMAGLLQPDIFPSQIDPEGGASQAQVVLQSHPHPFLGILWNRQHQRHPFAQRMQLRVVLPGQLAQGFAGVRQLVDRFDFLRHGGVETGLGVIDVGDGRQTDLEAAVALFELAGEGVFFGGGVTEVVQRRQDAEIHLRNPQHQFVADVAEIDFGAVDRRLRQALADVMAPVVERLHQAQGIGVAVGGRGRGRHALGSKPITLIGGHAHVRQQQGARLWFGFPRRVPAGGRGLEHRIAVLGLLVDAQQILRPRRPAAAGGDESGEHQTTQFGHG